jgi:SAM-dependent methyltransferase
MLIVFCATLFLSAALLFIIQLFAGKLLLPFLGGTPAVWNTCMVFFQALLLAGYLYAHALPRWFKPRTQLLVHFVMLLLPLLPLAFLHFDVASVAEKYPPPGETNPIPWLLFILLMIVGLPFLVVATSAPLLQKWFSSTDHPSANDPYFLYGASNLGSVLGLLGYPTFIEPMLRLNDRAFYFTHTQAFYWTAGYLVLVAMTMICGWLTLSRMKEDGVDKGVVHYEESPEQEEGPQKVPTIFTKVRWVLLAFVPSSMMLGVTTHITTDVAAYPMLWVLPLSVYLISFILVFSRIPLVLSMSVVVLLPLVVIGALTAPEIDPASSGNVLYQIRHFMVNLLKEDFARIRFIQIAGYALTILFVFVFFRSHAEIHQGMIILLPCFLLLLALEPTLADRKGLALKSVDLVLLHLGALFVTAMVCHGELARTRPPTKYLTGFYLLMSLGGVLGGIFNTIIAPQLFDRIWEYPLIMAVACLLLPRFELLEEKTEEGGEAKIRKDTAFPAFVAVLLFVFGVVMVGSFVARSFVTREQATEYIEENIPEQLQPTAIRWANTMTVPREGLIHRERNFFGYFTIYRYKDYKFLEETDIGPAVGAWQAVGGQALTPGGPPLGLMAQALVASEVARSDDLVFVRWPGETVHWMLHGTTTHGEQIYLPEYLRKEPITYFHRTGPIGQFFEAVNQREGPQNVAVLGMGTGTLAAYMKPGWTITFYEIDPAVVRVAGLDSEYFTYIKDAKARGVNVNDPYKTLGDGRLQLAKAEDNSLDVLFMDAFTSDAVPVHLITKEALEIYLKKLKPDGLLVINIANRYLDLEPVLGNLAEALGLEGYSSGGPNESSQSDEMVSRTAYRYANHWVVLARKGPKGSTSPQLQPLISQEPNEGTPKWEELQTNPSLGLWTDDYSNLLRVYSWR